MSEPGTEWKRRVFGAGYVTPEQRRERDIDEAVREGMNRALDEGLATWALESAYAVRAYIAPHVLQAWREQHA